MGVVSVGNFRLTADDPAYPIPADSTVDKTLYLVYGGSAPQNVHVKVTDVHGKTVSDKDYPVSLTPAIIHMPKGANLATVTPSKVGPSDQRIGFYLG